MFPSLPKAIAGSLLPVELAFGADLSFCPQSLIRYCSPDATAAGEPGIGHRAIPGNVSFH
jgi:hypothetical protein